MALKLDPPESVLLWSLRQGQATLHCYLTSAPNGDIVVEILQLQMIIRRVKADDNQTAQAISREWQREFMRAGWSVEPGV
jgi:hypothetical protein